MSIEVSVENHVCTVSMARVDKKNALTHTMYAALADAISHAQSDEQIRVIVIQGQGQCFTAGNDMHDFAQAEGADRIADNVRFMNALAECKLPVVASVQGLAVGIGTTMLLHCDLVICEKGARFVMPFVNLALVPEFASSYLLPKIAGHRKASKWLMLGEPFDASEAETFGLVSEIVDSQQLSTRTTEVAQLLAAKPRQALMHTKALMKNEQEEIQLHMNDELDIFIDQLSTEAAQEAITAFLEKRKPNPAKFR